MYKKKKSKGTIIVKPRKDIPQGVSREETEVANIVQLEFPNKKIERSNRQILNGRELDIYIPENKVAIEFDGVYFHSTAKKDDEFYHLWKTIECEKRGIRLIHVLSDEWELKRPLVIDIIRKALGKFSVINAKECFIQEISRQEEKVFLERYHLLGDFESSLCIGLLYKNNIIMIASFANKDDVWMITRLCFKAGIIVPDGLTSILDYFKDHIFKGDVYASIDRRFEAATPYLVTGFSEINPTNPRATYTKDFKQRFRECDFKNFNESALIRNGWQKVYDCGRRRFVLRNHND